MYGLERGFKSDAAFQSHFWTGSITTFEGNNPSFRVFEIDQEHMVPVKIDTYFLDIANDHTWKHHHEFTELYGIKDLSPASMDDLSTQFKTDEQLALKYQKSKHNFSVNPDDSCNKDCRKQIYCQTRNSVYFEQKDCLGEEHIDFLSDFTNSLIETLGGTWYKYDPWAEK